MTPADLLNKLRVAIGEDLEVDLDPAAVRFLMDAELLYVPGEVITHRSMLRGVDEQAFWRELLDQPRTWLHLNLLIDAEGNPVVSLRGGPRVAPENAAETPVAVSVERLRLRVVD